MEELEVKYGLPREVKFCARCVISNQRPNSAVEYQHTADSKKQVIHFDDMGICDACRVGEAKKSIDWSERERELHELCDHYRRGDGRYDCIVPGSGGKDSVMQSHLLKYKYGMHPLTITWAPHMYTDWGRRNFQSWIEAGFDNHLVTPNPRVHRLLTRLAVEKLFHPFQPFIIGQKALAAKFSVMLNIPLIFYGENEAEYGNPREDIEQAKRSWAYSTADDKSQIYLSGVSVAELTSDYELHANDLETYLPANPEDMTRAKTEIHYLGYYLRWHPQGAYYYAHENAGFQAAPERTPGTYSKYNSIDDKIDDFHYYTTFIKFGIGRATYDAAQEVRSGDITRDEGVALVRRYDGEFPTRFSEEIFEYLSITQKEFPAAFARFAQPTMTRASFEALADQFRSPHLWKQENGAWMLRDTVWQADN